MNLNNNYLALSDSIYKFTLVYGVLKGYVRVLPGYFVEFEQFVVVGVDDGYFVGEKVGDYEGVSPAETILN